MNDQNPIVPTALDALDGFTALDLDADSVLYGSDDLAPAREPFVPNYTPLAGTRILRARLYGDAGGVATVTFRGTLDPQALWVERGTSGRLSVYAEVTRSADTDTVLRVALVPTGKRVPEDAQRLGSGKGMHAYLLSALTQPRPAEQDAEPVTAATDLDAAPLA